MSSAPSCSKYVKFLEALSNMIKMKRDLTTSVKPKSDKENDEEYTPITPYNLDIKTDFSVKHEVEDKNQGNKRLITYPSRS